MRSNLIDFIRGIAFILMLIHHRYYFDPKYYSVPYKVDKIGLISRSLFILLVGFNIKFYNKKKINYNNQLKILIGALLVTISTYIFLPHDKVIFFGILHFIFISSLLMKHLSFSYLLIILVFIFSKYMNSVYNYNTNNYVSLALGGNSFKLNPIDIFQLFNWLPLLCIGMILGGITKIWFNKLYYPSNYITRLIEFIGKNSLVLYVLHVIPCIYWMSFKFKK